ncbi:CHD5-like protein-domain-containing protein [Macrophomina phaseolina]|uniref:CHD5-like protein-domain-containing protein n=1 Tax=Macrophomina phaseolina TaxID=35725 RepID=A0ABQ8GNY6_9PEZI|nr:CHD5-like protein-domain-containing protein [Macrophomina phaseolina]
MASLLLVIFIVSLATHLVNSIPAAALNELLWILYNKLPTPTSKAAREQVKLKHEVLRLKKEMNGVSAQDDFARWAKLRRSHDKVFADLQKSDSGIRSARTSFDTTVASIRWVLTNGLRFFLQFWYAKQPLFWIPQGWVPGYVWGVACASVISLVSEALVALYSLATGKVATKAERKKEEPVLAAGVEKKEL